MIFFNASRKKSWVGLYKKYFFISILFLLYINVEIAEADNNFTFRHFTSADGLTSNNIGAIMQDSRGFLWIATEDGLNMYDGQSIKQYYLSDYIPSQANNNVISGIAEDIDQNILISA